VLVREGRSEVEGVVQPSGPPITAQGLATEQPSADVPHATVGYGAGCGAGGSRWVRDTHLAFTRHDTGSLLRSVLQTLGCPLEALLQLAPAEDTTL
jgi:hypothetical protein